MRIYRRFDQAGLTLLELLIVVAILSSLSFMALTMLDSNGNDQRLQTTNQKIEAIRYAIIGDPLRKANGATEVRGFIADVGVPPSCIEDLFRANASCNDAGVAYSQADHASSPIQVAGWRGPYLPGTAEDFQDGWGRLINVDNTLSATAIEQDSVGVFRSNTTVAETIVRISSFGRDGVITALTNSTSPFDEEIIDTISSTEAFVPVKGLLVHFGTATAGCYGFNGAADNMTKLQNVLTIESECNDLAGANWTDESYPNMKLKLRYPADVGSLIDVSTESINATFEKKEYTFIPVTSTTVSNSSLASNSTIPSNTTVITASVALQTSPHNAEKYLYFPINSTASKPIYYLPRGIRSVQVMQNSTSVYPAELSLAPSELPVLFLPGASLGPISWIYGKQY